MSEKTNFGSNRKDSENKRLEVKTNNLGSSVKVQPDLFRVECQIEINGIEMGVLENGIPFLTENGLARMCGINRTMLNRLAVSWEQEKLKPRGTKIQELLIEDGYNEDVLFLKSENKGITINAYTEPVCLAILEYYAFISDTPKSEARRSIRSLARITFRNFIYQATGYSPNQTNINSWKHFHDRIDLTESAPPLGFFGVFKEISIMIVPMIKNGMIISDKVIPDISVGIHWSNHWQNENLSSLYGDRTKYEHFYPEYYPQAKVNPQLSYAYPNASLGYFRDWLLQNYINNHFPKYLLSQKNSGKLLETTTNKILESFNITQKIQKN